METDKFIELAKNLVMEETNKDVDLRYYYPVKAEDVYVVWYSKTIQNHKALLGTHIPDRKYFEATYNGDKEELYLDIYTKTDKITKEVV